MFTAWWVWALAGLVLAILEVVAPTYILLGFAIGAGIVSLGLLTGLLGGMAATAYGVAWLIVTFAILSLIAWLVLRAVFGKPGGTVQTFEKDIND
ncbi:MAG: hypothetical protein WBA02_16350 [Jannaschia helgolandensis]|jgi:membrane protein implicated in regulation of membrane protease activity|uniref:NfeD-like C-terminal, partner-binding n=1 Tax=Jannaschia helgolandensis TaxID=188906 RepID=A0A1H7HWG7_9RHOB|nr:hypothetical protein [Jannaschia helgolandensis]SEK54619.1 hypothetical protein SAMN04488526_0846 [Jannaschia helgolandensis]|tara:strand:- start:342 stop:626 length:285 start_codon:yes stop_codon:yes gene_type:complete